MFRRKPCRPSLGGMRPWGADGSHHRRSPLCLRRRDNPAAAAVVVGGHEHRQRSFVYADRTLHENHQPGSVENCTGHQAVPAVPGLCDGILPSFRLVGELAGVSPASFFPRVTDCPVASLLAMTCRNLLRVRIIPGHCRGTAGKRPCNRSNASVFCMSLRTSAHTGVAIRFPRRETWQVGCCWGESAARPLSIPQELGKESENYACIFQPDVLLYSGT